MFLSCVGGTATAGHSSVVLLAGGKNITEGLLLYKVGVVMKHTYLTRLVDSDVLPSRVRALAVPRSRDEHLDRGIRVQVCRVRRKLIIELYSGYSHA